MRNIQKRYVKYLQDHETAMSQIVDLGGTMTAMKVVETATGSAMMTETVETSIEEVSPFSPYVGCCLNRWWILGVSAVVGIVFPTLKWVFLFHSNSTSRQPCCNLHHEAKLQFSSMISCFYFHHSSFPSAVKVLILAVAEEVAVPLAVVSAANMMTVEVAMTVMATGIVMATARTDTRSVRRGVMRGVTIEVIELSLWRIYYLLLVCYICWHVLFITCWDVPIRLFQLQSDFS